MNVLHLTLKKKWFDMIASGEKKEEYREIKPYWSNRLQRRYYDGMCDERGRLVFKHFDVVKFTNGYAKDAPTITVAIEDIEIGEAVPEWSDNWKGNVFKIKLGNILN